MGNTVYCLSMGIVAQLYMPILLYCIFFKLNCFYTACLSLPLTYIEGSCSLMINCDFIIRLPKEHRNYKINFPFGKIISKTIRY